MQSFVLVLFLQFLIAKATKTSLKMEASNLFASQKVASRVKYTTSQHVPRPGQVNKFTITLAGEDQPFSGASPP